jgi:hypothetical protein
VCKVNPILCSSIHDEEIRIAVNRNPEAGVLKIIEPYLALRKIPIPVAKELQYRIDAMNKQVEDPEPCDYCKLKGREYTPSCEENK